MSEAMLSLHIETLKGGKAYLATCPGLPGLVAEGRTIEETLEIARDVARKLAESYIEHGDPLPPALRQVQKKDMDMRIPVGLP
jgi:predicted RNase H-like HicB family nuclease